MKIKKYKSYFFDNILGHSFLFFTLLFFFYLIPIELLFTKTLPTGGDHPGHFYNLRIILESFNLRNWNPLNLAGEALNTHYFPMMFAILSGGSFLLGPEIAYKLLIVIAIIIAPLSLYVLVYKRFHNKILASLALIFSMILTFENNNFNWGLSAISTLTGLISQSLAFFFFILFIDRIIKIKNFKKIDIKLLFYILMTCLTHPYIAINIPIIFLTRYIFLKEKRDFLFFTLKNLLFVILLSLWWLCPMFANIENNSSFSFKSINNFTQFISKEMIAIIILNLVIIFYFVAKNKIKFSLSFFSIPLVLLIFSIITFALFPRVGLVDSRALGLFYYAVFTLLFLCATRIGRKPVFFLTLALFLSFIPLHKRSIHIAKTMLTNDFKGPFNPQSMQVIETLKDALQTHELINDNRIAYEFNPHFLWQFGSDRFFETLPDLILKPTFDGLYVQANQYSKYAHYFQSLLGQNNQCLPQENCSVTIDLKKAAELMPILGIDTILLTSFYAQSEALKYKFLFDQFIKLPYGILLVKNNIKNYYLLDHIPPAPKHWKSYYLDELKNGKTASITSTDNCNVTVDTTLNQIFLKTDCVGKPHILKYMFIDSMETENGIIFRAPYGYMGVIPQKNEVLISYGDSLVFIMSKWISLVSFFILLTVATWTFLLSRGLKKKTPF